MLQNPSKYHSNPLSHFLALHHNNQMAHTGRSPILMPDEAQTQHFQQHLQQQQNNNTSYDSTNTSRHAFDTNNSTLDAGKSFTIAAILGLQKNAIDNSHKDYNNVINLSINDTNALNTNTDTKSERHLLTNNNSNNNHSNNKNKGKMDNTDNFVDMNNFGCDKAALMSRYLPSVNTTATNVYGTTTSHQQHQQSLISSHVRANSFVAAAAVAAAAAANAANAANNSCTPSALQSLQQLHQHHAQQNSLQFPREKVKENTKRSSMKNKRVRTIFTPEQLERLEAEFERQQYMVGPERLYLAHTLQLTEAQVKVWFQNRRIKWRKHHLEITHQRLAILRQNQLPHNPTTGVLETGSAPSTQSTPTEGEEYDELKYTEEMKHLSESRHASDSDLSVCNDSLDDDSAIDGGDET